jgi:hypothetical protein
MKSAPRVTTFSIPIPLRVFQDLCTHREKTHFRQEIFEMAGAAIQYWLAAQPSGADVGARAPALNGYQWKELFLPSGTLLRTVFKGRNFHAKVEGDNIVFDGKGVTPSEFANAVGGEGRNAWRVIWLCFPNETAWKRAASCRG